MPPDVALAIDGSLKLDCSGVSGHLRNRREADETIEG